MAHYFESGMMVRKPAWHGLGNVVADYPENWAAARKLAGIEWEPVYATNYGFRGVNADGDVVYDAAEAVTGEYFADENKRRVVRSDTGDLLGVANDSYEIISNGEMGEVVEALLAQRGMKYETLISTEGGRCVSCTMFLDEPIRLPGDPSLTVPYLSCTNRHDGGGALKAMATMTRVVCANTAHMAELEGERNGTLFTFRHTQGWKDRLEEARLTVLGLRRDVDRYRALATDLLGIKTTPAQRERFVVEFIASPPAALVSDRVAKNIEEARQAVRDILGGETCNGIANTAYGLLQAGTEYLDHYRATRTRIGAGRAESHTYRTLLRTEPLKTKVIRVIQDVVRSA